MLYPGKNPELRARLTLKAVFALLLSLSAALAGAGFFFELHARTASDCCEELRNGDVVFVEGRTWRSSLVRLARLVHPRGGWDSSGFSHVGIVRMFCGLPCVIHASPEDGIVKLESAEDFLATARIGGSGVYRLRAGGGAAEAASSAAWEYFARGCAFDRRFDMSTEDEIYCTELIWLAYRRAGVDLAKGIAFYDSSLYGRVMLPADLSRSRLLVALDAAVWQAAPR
ncbi:MAG: hypothetical protein LBS93_08580 [Synergistaceae bacterium]|nr:hypothetical protein [Synergistaceae bacterium]